MATTDPNINKEYEHSAHSTINAGTAGNGVNHQDHATTATGAEQHPHVNGMNGGMTPAQRAKYDYGGNPLAHINTGQSARFPAFGGEFQPGLYKPTTERKFANPAPLGLCGFALTTFVLSLVNVQTHNITNPNIVVSLAYGYGGLVQLLAGMWEMAIGNTFGATALSSYGGFWLSLAILLTPGGFEIVQSYEATGDFDYAFGLFLFGWFIFTTILLLCTLRSTVAFFLLFFTLDIAFLMLAIGHVLTGTVATNCVKAGGYFGLFAAFLAWYNAFAGIADTGNSFFLVPVAHFPWSEKGRKLKEDALDSV